MRKIMFFAMISSLLLSSCGASSDSKGNVQMESAAPQQEIDYANADSTASMPMAAMEERKMEAASPQQAEQKTSSQAAPDMRLSATQGKKFILTADIRAQVENVRAANVVIERLTRLNGGYVASSQLVSEPVRESETPISPDSVLVSRLFRSNLDVTIRVPFNQFDTLLTDLDKLYLLIETRNIRADNIAPSLLRNNMNNKRLKEFNARMSKNIDQAQTKRNTTLDETNNAEENILQKGQQTDQNTLQNIDLEDKVMFSTVTLRLYQAETLQHYKIANRENIKAYEPSFGKKLSDAFSSGTDALQQTIIIFVNLWWLWLIIGIVIIAYRRLKTKKQS